MKYFSSTFRQSPNHIFIERSIYRIIHYIFMLEKLHALKRKYRLGTSTTRLFCSRWKK